MEFYGTLGESCARRETLDRMFQAGMTGMRLNLSHAALPQWLPMLKSVYWPSARAAGRTAHLILDLQGPELRVGRLDAPISLEKGAHVCLGTEGIPVPAQVLDAAEPGDVISLDDSALRLTVEKTGCDSLLCRVERGGLLTSR